VLDRVADDDNAAKRHLRPDAAERMGIPTVSYCAGGGV
jgi:hypothetical protein